MSAFLQELVTHLLTVSIVVAGMSWVAQAVITHILSRDIEKHKNRLERDVEEFRHSMELKTIEHDARARRIDAKVAERLEEAYERLQILFDATGYFITHIDPTGPTKEQRRDDAYAKYFEWEKYIKKSRIYVPPALYYPLCAVGNRLFSTASQYEIHRQNALQEGDPDSPNNWIAAFTTLKDEHRPFFDTLIAEIQKRLGVTD